MGADIGDIGAVRIFLGTPQRKDDRPKKRQRCIQDSRSHNYPFCPRCSYNHRQNWRFCQQGSERKKAGGWKTGRQLFSVHICEDYFFASSNPFQSTAARIAPKIGATMKSHSCAKASPQTNTAGPKLRAGLTDVPVTGIPTMCITARAIPMAKPPNPLAASALVRDRRENRYPRAQTRTGTSRRPFSRSHTD